MTNYVTGIIALLLINFSVWSQNPDSSEIVQPFRFEKERKYSDEDFTIISLKEEGLALIREKNKYKGGNRTWEVILLDNELKETQNLDLEIDQRKNLVGYEQVPGLLFLLFKYGETQKIALDLISIRLADSAISRYEIKPELPLQLTHFSRVAENFIFGGYVNSEPAVLLFNPTADNLKVIPGFFQKQTELMDLRPNQNQTFNVILIDRSDRSQQKIMFKTFDAFGVELLQDIIPVDDKYIIQTGISSMLIREELTIIGTWGSRNSKQALGFFTVLIDPFTDQQINYVAFGELDHYLDYQNPKRAKKLKERTRELITQSRLPDFTNYVMPYKIDEGPNGFLLLAETYSPSNTLSRYPDPYAYGTSPYPYFSPFWGYYPGTYNRMYNPYYYNNPNNFRGSDEIKLLQSVLIAFDGTGKPRWDYNLDLEDLRSPMLDQIADFCVFNNTVYFLHKKESELIIKSITLDSKDVYESAEKIKLLNSGDEIRSENKSAGGARQWYGNSFYVWGQHAVKNRTNREEGLRQVFYINKVDTR